MSQNSISSGASPQNSLDSQADNYPLAVDAEDWELRIAKLVGFAEEPLSDDGEVVEESANKEPSPPEPIAEKTEQPLSTNPFAKLGLVGTATFILVVFTGGFLTQIMSSNEQQPRNKQIAVQQTPSPNTQQSKEAELEEKVETLKTKLALTEQAEAVKLAQQQLRNGKQIASAESRVPQTPRGDNSVRQTPIPTSTVYVPRTVTVERIVKSPSVPVASTASTLPPSPPIIPNPQPQPLVPVIPSSPPNPWQIWQNLAKLGSYGEVGNSDRNYDNTTDQPQPNSDREEQQATNPEPEATPKQQAPRISQGISQNPQTLAVGSNAKAVLATAVFGETSDSAEKDNANIFVVRLQEPLKAIDGAIAIPANTEILTQMSSLSEQGLVKLEVLKLIVPVQGKLTERTVQQNALTIRAPQGKPLIANQFPNRGSSIAGMDIGLFVLGGLGKAAELMNRTDAQVVTTTGSTTIVNSTNPDRNILAGIFEGGMNTVVPQIAQRNQQAIAQMSQRTNVWFLPAGTAVEIYVNQSIQL
ncbi:MULTISPECIES: TrbI/VirB10 family protein [Calothrix]|uniref:TrbI/VirB10 family protein n=2 Tax=Calothrix TaxID=1186 RepID=A0ABR8A924_9CYAN|nr:MULTISPECIES: TrbI/VirB10 family protein [Calothrix]MBD2196159.1 TrbI/VirB10 family protein [Calothrix parietina FACHB-288]MBD2224812.1 TrbI/VirB10 family protein [Calothrix anomala FACHB-343]